MARSILLMVALACGVESTEDEPCSRTCRELVSSCDLVAFPSVDSCLSGCEAEQAVGLDVEAYGACVRAAECDLVAIIECPHAQ